jgi:hypothetical protein
VAANHPEAYWRAVAKGLEAESEKASLYVTHRPSLGVAREAIFRRILIDETPSRYSVKTGLIREKSSDGNVSRQCDLLVYDPTDDTPFYRMGEFVVVCDAMARMVVEVKSNLTKKQLPDILNIWRSTRILSKPTHIFAYQGLSFKNFVAEMSNVIKANSIDSPPCVAVHSKNYLAIRATHWMSPCPHPYLILDFRRIKGDSFGMATAYFLQWYFQVLDGGSLDSNRVTDWFNRVPVTVAAKAKIAPDGTVS